MVDRSEHSASQPETTEGREEEATVRVEGSAARADAADASRGVRGTVAGRFVLLEEVGEGGMGRVHRAYDPKLQREVAVKLMRATDDTSTERMLREARAMAQLSHPNVLPVYDVGEHGRGLFIAMEFVEGKTLRRWCQDDRPTWREIVRVFVDAGRGLAAAHRAGLVHRDFKPDNVLVDREHRVRVMDFGLARAADELPIAPAVMAMESSGSSGSMATALTEAGTVLGTPAYMAPEQHRDGAGDRRSDQYAYCVALYEAVHGQRPFAGRNVLALASAKQQLRIRDLPEHAPGVPKWLERAILRGLAPDPAQRWPSVDALLAELQRGAAGSWRRKLSFVLAGLVLIVPVGAYLRHRAQICAGAQQQLASAWSHSRAETLQASFLATGVPNAADAWTRTHAGMEAYAERWTTSHTEACEATRKRGEQSQAVMDARMRCLQGRRRELGALVDTLARADASVVQKAIEAVGSLPRVERCDDIDYVLAQVAPPDDPELEPRIEALRERLAVARALHSAGRHAEGLPIAQQAMEEAERLGYVPLLAEASARLAALQEGSGEYEAALANLERAYFEALRSGMDELAAETAASLVFTLGYAVNRHDEALAWSRHARAEVDRAGTEEMLAQLLNHVGVVHYLRGAYAESQSLHEEALALQQRALGPEHPEIGASLTGLANVHHALGNVDEAIRLFERALALRQQAVGEDHPDVATALSNLGIAHRAKGSFHDSIAYNERALVMRERLLGPEHPEVAVSLSNLAAAHFSAGSPDKALVPFERALAMRERTFGRDHPKVADMLNNLAAAHAAQGNHELSGELHARALAIWEATHGPAHPRVAMSLNNLGNVARTRGDLEQASLRYQRALEVWEQTLGADHLHLSYPLTGLGELALERGRPEDGIAPLERALALREARGAVPHELADVLFALARALWDAPPGAGRDRPRAHALAIAARDALHASDDGERLHALETWLQEHRDAH